MAGLRGVEDRHGDLVSQVRGRGTLCAFDLPTPGHRNRAVDLAYEAGVVMLGCGSHSIRFRPPLTVTGAEIDEGLAVLDNVLATLARDGADPMGKGRK